MLSRSQYAIHIATNRLLVPDLRVQCLRAKLCDTPARQPFQDVQRLVLDTFRPRLPLTLRRSDDVTAWLVAHPGAQLDAVFHEGPLTYNALIRAFVALKPRLVSGAVVLVNRPHHGGWLALADQPRVACAIEIGRPSWFRETRADIGLLVLQ